VGLQGFISRGLSKVDFGGNFYVLTIILLESITKASFILKGGNMSKLIFLVVILGMIALCVGCQSGLSEEEVRSIVQEEEAGLKNIVYDLLDVVADLNTNNANLEGRVAILESQLTLLQVMRGQDTEECLGDMVSYIDDLDWYLNDVSSYLDDVHDYLMGYTIFLGIPPLLPPYWSFTSCPGY
jgi:hypothetical protein